MDLLVALGVIFGLVIVVTILLIWAYRGYIRWSDLNVDESIRHRLSALIADHPSLTTARISSHPEVVTSFQITFVSGCIDRSGNRSWADISRRRLVEYANLYGYNVAYFNQPLNPEAPLIWQKVYAVRNAFLDPRCQVVVWIDDDLLITSPYRIEHFLSMSDRPIIVSSDIPSDWNTINTGIFILRRTDTTMTFLDEVITNRTILGRGYFNRNLYHEQSVMTYLLYSRYIDMFTLLPLGTLQTLSVTNRWQDDHFSLHLAGECREKRNRLIEEMYERTKHLFA